MASSLVPRRAKRSATEMEPYGFSAPQGGITIEGQVLLEHPILPQSRVQDRYPITGEAKRCMSIEPGMPMFTYSMQKGKHWKTKKETAWNRGSPIVFASLDNMSKKTEICFVGIAASVMNNFNSKADAEKLKVNVTFAGLRTILNNGKETIMSGSDVYFKMPSLEMGSALSGYSPGIRPVLTGSLTRPEDVRRDFDLYKRKGSSASQQDARRRAEPKHITDLAQDLQKLTDLDKALTLVKQSYDHDPDVDFFAKHLFLASAFLEQMLLKNKLQPGDMHKFQEFQLDMFALLEKFKKTRFVGRATSSATPGKEFEIAINGLAS